MRRSIFIISMISGLLVLAGGCRFVGLGETVRGSGKMTTETRDVGDFRGIALGGVGTVFVEFGNENAVRIEAEDNLLPYIETEVRGDVLKIGNRPMVNLRSRAEIRYYVTVRYLDRLSVSGSGEIRVPEMRSERLDIRVSGSGDLDIRRWEGESMAVGISGSGGVFIGGGHGFEQEVNISGSGDLKAPELTMDKVDASISGSGTATVHVRDRLKASISGSGTFFYTGEPAITTKTSGSGRVVRR
ncbi:MAG: DUF2807 domain-containing protein [Acidobacteria bacterium]|nr:DUF2807 domain-containing protein [Acidobacteriota bacterium]